MLSQAFRIMGDRRSCNPQRENERIQWEKSSITPVPKEESGSRDAFSRVLGHYTVKNVCFLSLQLYNYLSETRRILKRSHRFLKLANQKFLFVHFFACRVAEETSQYTLDYYMKEALVAYVKLELTIIQDPEYSADFSEQTALKERVLGLLWTIYSKYMFYLTGRSCRSEVYAVILKLLHAELPSKIPGFFREFFRELKNLVSGAAVGVPYFSSPVQIKAEPCDIPQNIFHEDPNTSGFIWDELKKMQKQADDRRQMKEQAECIEIEDDDDDVQVTYARSVSAAPQNFKPLRTSSRHSSENLDPPCGTRELTNRAKAVLLQFQKMFGSEGVSMSINGNGKLVIGTTLSLDQDRSSESLWETSSAYQPLDSYDGTQSPSAGDGLLRPQPQNYPQYRPCFEVVQRPEILCPRTSTELDSSKNLAMFASAKPCEVVLPNRHEVLQSATFLSAAEEPIDLSRHAPEEPAKLQTEVLSESKTEAWLCKGNSSCSSGSLIVDEDQLLQEDDSRQQPSEVLKPALNILSVLKMNIKHAGRDLKLCVVEDEKTIGILADRQQSCQASEASAENPPYNLAIAAELQPGNRIKTVSLPLLATDEEVNCVSLYSTVATNNPQYTSEVVVTDIYPHASAALEANVPPDDKNTPDPLFLDNSIDVGSDESSNNPGSCVVKKPTELVDPNHLEHQPTMETLSTTSSAIDVNCEVLHSSTSNPNEALESLTVNSGKARDNLAESLTATPTITDSSVKSLSANLEETLESLTTNLEAILHNLTDSSTVNPDKILNSSVESSSPKPKETLENSVESLAANSDASLVNPTESVTAKLVETLAKSLTINSDKIVDSSVATLSVSLGETLGNSAQNLAVNPVESLENFADSLTIHSDKLLESSDEFSSANSEGTLENTVERLTGNSDTALDNSDESFPPNPDQTLDGSVASSSANPEETLENSAESLSTNIHETVENSAESITANSAAALDNSADRLPPNSNQTLDSSVETSSAKPEKTLAIFDEKKRIENCDERLTANSDAALDHSTDSLPPNPEQTLDNSVETSSANSEETFENFTESLSTNLHETLENSAKSLSANSDAALDHSVDRLPPYPDQALDSSVETQSANPEETLENSAESSSTNLLETLENPTESLTADSDATFDNSAGRLTPIPHQILDSSVETSSANPEETLEKSSESSSTDPAETLEYSAESLAANSAAALGNSAESLTASPDETLDNLAESLSKNPDKILDSSVGTLSTNPHETRENCTESLTANPDAVESLTANPAEAFDNSGCLDKKESTRDSDPTEDNSEATVAHSSMETTERARLEALDVVSDPVKVDKTVDDPSTPVKPSAVPSELLVGSAGSICNPVEVVSPILDPNFPVFLLDLAEIAAEQSYQVCNDRRSSDREVESSDSDRLIISTTESAVPARSRHKTKAELKQEMRSIAEETDVDDDLPLAYRFETTAGKSQNRRRSNAGKSRPKSPARKREIKAKPRRLSAKSFGKEEVDAVYTSKLRSRASRTSKDEDTALLPVSELPTPEKKIEEKVGRSRGRPRKKSSIKSVLERDEKPIRLPMVPFCQPVQEEKKQPPQLSKVLSRLKENLKKASLDGSESELPKKRKSTKRASSDSVRHVTAETSNSSEIDRKNCKSETFQKASQLQSEISDQLKENVTPPEMSDLDVAKEVELTLSELVQSSDLMEYSENCIEGDFSVPGLGEETVAAANGPQHPEMEYSENCVEGAFSVPGLVEETVAAANGPQHPEMEYSENCVEGAFSMPGLVEETVAAANGPEQPEMKYSENCVESAFSVPGLGEETVAAANGPEQPESLVSTVANLPEKSSPTEEECFETSAPANEEESANLPAAESEESPKKVLLEKDTSPDTVETSVTDACVNNDLINFVSEYEIESIASANEADLLLSEEERDEKPPKISPENTDLEKPKTEPQQDINKPSPAEEDCNATEIGPQEEAEAEHESAAFIAAEPELTDQLPLEEPPMTEETPLTPESLEQIADVHLANSIEVCQVLEEPKPATEEPTTAAEDTKSLLVAEVPTAQQENQCEDVDAIGNLQAICQQPKEQELAEDAKQIEIDNGKGFVVNVSIPLKNSIDDQIMPDKMTVSNEEEVTTSSIELSPAQQAIEEDPDKDCAKSSGADDILFIANEAFHVKFIDHRPRDCKGKVEYLLCCSPTNHDGQLKEVFHKQPSEEHGCEKVDDPCPDGSLAAADIALEMANCANASSISFIEETAVEVIVGFQESLELDRIIENMKSEKRKSPREWQSEEHLVAKRPKQESGRVEEAKKDTQRRYWQNLMTAIVNELEWQPKRQSPIRPSRNPDPPTTPTVSESSRYGCSKPQPMALPRAKQPTKDFFLLDDIPIDKSKVDKYLNAEFLKSDRKRPATHPKLKSVPHDAFLPYHKPLIQGIEQVPPISKTSILDSLALDLAEESEPKRSRVFKPNSAAPCKPNNWQKDKEQEHEVLSKCLTRSSRRERMQAPTRKNKQNAPAPKSQAQAEETIESRRPAPKALSPIKPPEEEKKTFQAPILEKPIKTDPKTSFDYYPFNMESGLIFDYPGTNNSFSTSGMQDAEQVFETITDPAIASRLASIQGPSLLDVNEIKQECAPIEPSANGTSLERHERDSWISGKKPTETILGRTRNNLPTVPPTNLVDDPGWLPFTERVVGMDQPGLIMGTDEIKQQFVPLGPKESVLETHNFTSIDLDDYSGWPLDMTNPTDPLDIPNGSMKELPANVMDTETQPSLDCDESPIRPMNGSTSRIRTMSTELQEGVKRMSFPETSSPFTQGQVPAAENPPVKPLDIPSELMNELLDHVMESETQASLGCNESPIRPMNGSASRIRTINTELQEGVKRMSFPETSSPFTQGQVPAAENPPDNLHFSLLSNSKKKRSRNLRSRNTVQSKPQDLEPVKVTTNVKRESSRQAARELEQVLKRSVVETSLKDKEGFDKTNNGNLKDNSGGLSSMMFRDGQRPQRPHVYAPILKPTPINTPMTAEDRRFEEAKQSPTNPFFQPKSNRGGNTYFPYD